MTTMKTIIENYVWETNVQQTNLLIINKHLSTFNQIPRASERAQKFFLSFSLWIASASLASIYTEFWFEVSHAI